VPPPLDRTPSPRSPVPPARPAARRLLAGAALALAAIAAALPAPAAAGPGEATVVLAARSIGSRRGEPLDPRAHAALLVRFEGRAGGFIVQGGKEAVAGSLLGTRHRVVGWAIPAQDPSAEFARAAGGYWGEPDVRVVPTRELARFAVKGLTEARVRELVESLNRELRDRDYRLEGGPCSNSYVSRFLDRLGITLPPLAGEQLPGWGWRP
jgi:hypothetical protein